MITKEETIKVETETVSEVEEITGALEITIDEVMIEVTELIVEMISLGMMIGLMLNGIQVFGIVILIGGNLLGEATSVDRTELTTIKML